MNRKQRLRAVQEDNLRQLQEIRKSGVDDDGHLMSPEALADLDLDIASLARFIREEGP
jgi:hypothetical protein